MFIEYRTGSDPVTASPGFALCEFAAGRASLGQPDLLRIVTPSGEISGARLYLLKHYYLDTPEAQVAAPASDDRTLALPELPPALAYAAQALLQAAPRAAFYALLAAAYALIYGLTGRINLAFGEIAAIAAAALGISVAGLALSVDAAPLLALPVGIAAALAAGAIHSAVVGHLAFLRIRASQASLIATIGSALALMEYLRLAQGARPNWLPPLTAEAVPLARAGGFVVTVSPVAIGVDATGLVAVAALLVVLRRSRYGRAWRACADDPHAAALFGIDVPRLTLLTLALAGAGAGLAAALMTAQFGALGFADGFALGLKALLAAILGGIGSVPAAIVGGLCIGLFESLWSAYWPIEARDGALLCALALVVVLKPDGLFATPDPRRQRI